jgi:hypothetical protein
MAHLPVAVKRDHNIRALKRQTAETLRQCAAKGRKVGHRCLLAE